jgi:LuxR family transcriptional regulator, maltose regulon positive regulatory protein
MEVATSFPISKTKIIAPKRRPEIVIRPRLIDAIYDLLDKKLILISAPAGSGKSSLLVDFVDQSEIPVCWLSLDELDQEPQRFLSYFAACIHQRFPAFGKESYAALGNISSVEKDIERLVIVFTNEIHQNIPEHFAIVVDDYHFVDQVPEIRPFINRFVQLAGENCHLILASRTLPSLPDLHLLVAREQMGGISFEDLAFLPEEIQAFFRQNSDQRLSMDDAKSLAEETDGWITSLSSLSHIDKDKQQGVAVGRTGVELFDYFAREILEKQTPEVREFLLLTSMFDEIDTGLCRKILDPLLKGRQRDWKRLLNEIQKHNLFVIPLGAEGKSFRYHHLFQDYLQGKLHEENPGLFRNILNNLAGTYKEQQDWEKAHFIYEKMGDENALLGIVEEASKDFIRNGRVATLGNWLEHLPLSLLHNNPSLLSLQGVVASTQGQTQLGISLHSQAEKEFRAEHNVENLALTLVRRAAVYRGLGDYALSLNDSEEAIHLIEKNTKNSLKDTSAMAQREKGLALYYLGRTKEAISWLNKSLNLFSFLKEKTAIPALEMELGMAYRALGNSDTALKFYHSALEAWEATGNLGWQATLLNNLGVLYHSRGEYEQAFMMLEKALECTRRSGYIRTEALALCSLGDLLADLQDFDRCSECYEQALSIALQLADRPLAFYASLAKARIARLRSDFGLARKLLLDLNAPNENQIASSEEEALFRLEYGCFLLCSGKARASVDELTGTLNLYEQNGRLLELCVCKLWLACALIEDEQKEKAVLQLQDLFSAGKNLTDPALLYVNAGHTQEWLKKLHHPDDVLDSIQQLIGRAAQFERSVPSLRRKLRRISHTISISPPHLEIRAFGPARVLYNGKMITLSDWQTRETRDLFFFFLHSKPVTKEEIASIFWPEISPSRLKMRFKTSIYRLRHAIGQETILFEDERYRFNRGIDYEYDAENFLHLLQQADKTKSTTEAALLLKSAINLAEGSYLADIEAEWADLERTRINTLYQSTILNLADIYLQLSQPEKALDVCRIALDADPLIEEAHRLNMRAYAALGDQAAVVRQFRACSDIFQEELGVKPSKETIKLYQQLT